MGFWEGVLDEMKLRGFSQNTVKVYRFQFEKFLGFCGKKPARVSVDDAKKYLISLVDKEYSRETVRQTHSVLNFFFTYLGKETFSKVSMPKRKRKLPKVLSREKIERIISALSNEKHKLILLLLYGSGLRVSEVVKLFPEDVDVDRSTVRIRNGKGGKDRYTIFPANAEKLLLEYLLSKRKSRYLFPGRKGKLSVKSVQNIVRKAGREAKISQKVHPHMLRHSFATHLLESGVDIRHIQKLLGHSRLQTTQIYTKVSNSSIKKVKSPADSILIN